eukprot:4993385-Prymnesium_polylepis.2
MAGACGINSPLWFDFSSCLNASRAALRTVASLAPSLSTSRVTYLASTVGRSCESSLMAREAIPATLRFASLPSASEDFSSASASSGRSFTKAARCTRADVSATFCCTGCLSPNPFSGVVHSPGGAHHLQSQLACLRGCVAGTVPNNSGGSSGRIRRRRRAATGPLR